MASQWLKARQTKYAAYATTYILVVLAVVVVANYLANRYSKSWDATSNKRYSLSQESKKIVDGLKSPATITYFNVSTRFAEGKDLLDEYRALSSSKVQVKYVDPEKEPMLARAAGIRTIPLPPCRSATTPKPPPTSPKKASPAPSSATSRATLAPSASSPARRACG